MRIVLDTNVLVSGLLSPFGPAGEIMRLVVAGNCGLCVDARILAEYEAVLRRERFGFDPETICILLDFIRRSAELHLPEPLRRALPDPDDAPFLETALASRCDALVTGNVKHYPASCRRGVSVLTPRQFIDRFRDVRS